MTRPSDAAVEAALRALGVVPGNHAQDGEWWQYQMRAMRRATEAAQAVMEREGAKGPTP